MSTLLVLTSIFVCHVAGAQQEVEIRVDLDKPGAALSPYLYGQFIEHLGRCIRDGVWAEKLRDRKFLLPPGKTWEVVREGDGSDAAHDPKSPYTGRHCIRLAVPSPSGRAGIRQSGVGVVAGKEYVGYVFLAADRGPARVEARIGDQAAVFDAVGADYRKFPFRFRAAATSDAASLIVRLVGQGQVRVGCVSLMPAENRHGMRVDTLELIRKLRPPITRWPGGNFVSGYCWKDAIGPRDRRPPRWERAWNDVEDNDFGLDEFMLFCQEVATEPYVAVNTGMGSVGDAADEVEYANGQATTRWGAQRARNGHAEPYRIAWWGVGNEMYGKWQLGNVPIEQYVARHNAFVDAMRGKDPPIKLIAVGAPGKWNDLILAGCAKNMDLLSGHHYSERRLRLPFTPDAARQYEKQFITYSDGVAGGVRRLVADFRKRLDPKNPDVSRVRLAIDEWGIVRDWKLEPDGPGIGAFEHYYCLGDAIAVARAMHEILRSADVVAMANWAQTVNVIGTIKTSRTQAVLDPAGHVLALYRVQLGGTLVPLSVPSGTTVDAVAARAAHGGGLAVAMVNYSADREAGVRLRLKGSVESGWRINGPELGATNVPGRPEAVTTTVLPTPISLDRPLVLPAHSITVLRVR